ADGLRLNATNDDSIISLPSHWFRLAPLVGSRVAWDRSLFLQSRLPPRATSPDPEARAAPVRKPGPNICVRWPSCRHGIARLQRLQLLRACLSARCPD